ncbi:unnamed protein product, partial [Ascophyllum nodosum]
QDESVYKAYAREGNEWVIRGTRGLRKKSEGPREMVSAFQDERHGFGLPVADDQLKAINDKRKKNGKAPLKRSPGLRFLVVGKNKDGFWGYDQFKEQIEDVLDVLEHLDDGMQMVIEGDHSSGHAKQREDGLHVSDMNVKYGGKQKKLRDTVMTKECFGPEEAKMYFANGKWSTNSSEGAVVIDLKLMVGARSKLARLRRVHLLPFTIERLRAKTRKLRPRLRAKKKRARAREVAQASRRLEEVTTPLAELQQNPRIRSTKVADEKNIDKVLQTLPDFKTERTALQHVVESRGHILLLSPNCHPEVTGVGIEYTWGFSKQKFRRVHNDEVPKNLHANIEATMCTKNYLTIGQVRRFARRTREYCRAYRNLLLDGVVVKSKKQKAHRNI